MKMVAINSGDTAMAVAHVFAKANVRHRDQFRTFRFDCPERFLNHSVFCVSAACLLIFTRGNSEKQDSLQPEILSAPRFIDNLFHRKLKNSRHACDRPALIQLFTDEQRQNKIVNGQMRLTNEVSQGSGTPQPTRPMNQSSHEPESTRCKFGGKQTGTSPAILASLSVSMLAHICELTLK